MTVPRGRFLIVNADDYGQSVGVTAGVLRAHHEGIVTSASLMVRYSSAAHAAAQAKLRPQLSVGLHFDIGEWVYADGDWRTVYTVASRDDERGLRREFTLQLSRFRELMGRDPSHLDSHQHVHRHEPVRRILIEGAASLRVPLRHFDPDVDYCGEFYGQSDVGVPLPGAISVPGLLGVLGRLPEGCTELACHPSTEAEEASAYGRERQVELATLCDPAVRQAIDDHGITLCSFRDRPAGAKRERHSV